MPVLRWIRTGIAAAMLVLSAPVTAQQSDAPRAVVRSPILTLESERLFMDSAFGQRVVAAIEAEGKALAAENRAIEAELTAEERRLTDMRAEAEAAEFRALADAFDARVQALRQQQDAKARTLASRDDAARRVFFGAVQPVLGEILREAGAALILERSTVLLSANATDITDLAITRVDARIGDGEGLAMPEDAADDAPENGAADTPPAPDATRPTEGGTSLLDMGIPETGAQEDP
ncbi:OmpH/Skp family outer membrane protein [Roseivivax sp. CAU 1753]